MDEIKRTPAGKYHQDQVRGMIPGELQSKLLVSPLNNPIPYISPLNSHLHRGVGGLARCRGSTGGVESLQNHIANETADITRAEGY